MLKILMLLMLLALLIMATASCAPVESPTPPLPLTAEEQADLDLVEREARYEKYVTALVNQATERAHNALSRSSLGQRLESAKRSYRDARIGWYAYEQELRSPTLGGMLGLALMQNDVRAKEASYRAAKKTLEDVRREYKKVWIKAAREFLQDELMKVIDSPLREKYEKLAKEKLQRMAI